MEKQRLFPSKLAIDSLSKIAVVIRFHSATHQKVQDNLNLSELKGNVEMMLTAAGFTVMPEDDSSEQAVLKIEICANEVAHNGESKIISLQQNVWARLNTTLLLPATQAEVRGCIWSNHVFGLVDAIGTIERLRFNVKKLVQELIDIRQSPA